MTNGFDWSLYKGNLAWLPERTIYLARHGSHAYGTNVEGSDEDFRGVAIAPVASYLGVTPEFEHANEVEPDITIFELRKFVRLCMAGNPNVLETLFVDQSDVLHTSSLGRTLANMRELFLTQKVFQSFGGYARGQLRKLQHTEYASRSGEPSERKPSRSALVEKFGYDTKFACHLIRLLRVGREILLGHGVRVRRPDADELRDIRLGLWTYERVMQEAAEAELALNEAHAVSELPEEPHVQRIENIVVGMLRDAI